MSARVNERSNRSPLRPGVSRASDSRLPSTFPWRGAHLAQKRIGHLADVEGVVLSRIENFLALRISQEGHAADGVAELLLRRADNVGQGASWIFDLAARRRRRTEEHTSELQSIMRNSYDVFCLKKT